MNAKRDFEADRKLCAALADQEWTSTWNISTFTYMIYASDTVEGTSGKWWPSRVAEVPNYTTEQFIVEAKQGWSAALDEIETLNKIIHDLQIDSEAYRMGYEAGLAAKEQTPPVSDKAFVGVGVLEIETIEYHAPTNARLFLEPQDVVADGINALRRSFAAWRKKLFG